MENMEQEKPLKEGKISSFFRRNKYNAVIFVIILIIVVAASLYNKKYRNPNIYTLVNGYVEKATDTQAVVVKDEKVAATTSGDVAIPVIEQGKKAAKGEIIAIYKDDNYNNYLKEIEKMDKEIQTLISDLPVSYSSDIKDIENQISKISKEAIKTTSYIKMQEYKNKLDDLSYKKVLALGMMSPEGSKIRELIEEREAYEKKSKTSSNNIKAPASGIVTYKIDGLEDVINLDKVFRLNASDINDLMQQFYNADQNKFGIKIIDNYNAYLIIKEEKGINDEYIIKDKTYNIKLSDYSEQKITGNLVKIVEDESNYYCIFNIQNGIENLVDDRQSNVNIVWKKVSGMAVPKEYISKNEEKGYEYVTLIHAGEYVDIPIKIVIESDNICIVENMTSEEIENYGIDSVTKIEIYDQIVKKEKAS